jgi:hypothetical protein
MHQEMGRTTWAEYDTVHSDEHEESPQIGTVKSLSEDNTAS